MREDYKTDRLVKNQGIHLQGRHRVPDHEKWGSQSIALARGFVKGSIKTSQVFFSALLVAIRALGFN